MGLDWICVSPKAGVILILKHGTEIKQVFPQPQAMPKQFKDLEFKNFFLQPMDIIEQKRNIQQAVKYCMAHPKWRLSVQTYKVLGIS